MPKNLKKGKTKTTEEFEEEEIPKNKKVLEKDDDVILPPVVDTKEDEKEVPADPILVGDKFDEDLLEEEDELEDIVEDWEE